MNPAIFAHGENLAIAFGMGITAERVAERWKISREAQDTFAYESHLRAVFATSSGAFGDEIVPYMLSDHQANLATREVLVRSREVKQDEGPRADTSLDALSNLRPAFASAGSVTAGNSSQMSDGAAAILLCSEAPNA
jgi:acetyl-CoA acyltransferase